jgi:SAM-dependent methyltransferase
MAPLSPITFAKRCFFAASQGLSKLGEMVGSDALVYHPGVFRTFHRVALLNAPRFADAILAEFPTATSIADVGCGSGAYAAEFLRRTLRTVACERSPRGRRYAQRQGLDCQFFDLAVPDVEIRGLPVDLAFSLEVAEHIPASLADAFVVFLTRASDTVALTAAPPGQGGQGHINEQPQEYWIAKFHQRGFQHDAAASGRIAEALRAAGAARYLSANMMVFRRR